MDFESFVEGTLLWIVFTALIIGILVRLGTFFWVILKEKTDKDLRLTDRLIASGRSLIPFHMGVIKKPLYAALRYIFHICLIIVPIWLAGHIVLWEESRFAWSWIALPDAWADWMTLLVLGLAAYFLLRCIIIRDHRLNSARSDYLLIIVTALPFMTGYLLTHDALASISFFDNNMRIIHVLSGEAMILTALFLFCVTRLNIQKCTGCASCSLSCPTGALTSNDVIKLRIFDYSPKRCIHCGECVHTCPEDAAELRHELSPRRFFEISPKQEIRSVELEACQRCGALFVPSPQLDKIGETIKDNFIRFCPECKGKRMMMEIFDSTGN